MTNISQTTSSWTAPSQIPDKPTLAHYLRTELSLVGADFAGLTTSYLLARQQKKWL